MDVFGAVPDRPTRLRARRGARRPRSCEERLAIERARELGAPLMQTRRHPRTGRRYQARRRGAVQRLDPPGARRRPARPARRQQRGVLAARLARPQAAAPKAERPAALLPRARPDRRRAARRRRSIEAEHRGLTWEKVRAHPRLRRLGRRARPRVRRLGHADRQGPPRRALDRRAGAAQPQRRAAADRSSRRCILAGPRISEFCGAARPPSRPRRAAALRIPREATKTDAGERVVPLLPVAARAPDRPPPRLPGAPATTPAFPTRNGTPQHPDNVRARILAPIRARANELLAADGGRRSRT